MTRSPLFHAMGRGLDVDAGGAAELQTDVMRFMAILSLCLVAIFALVQSLPVTEKPTSSGTVTLTRAEDSGTVTPIATEDSAEVEQPISVRDPAPENPATAAVPGPEPTRIEVTVPNPLSAPVKVTVPEPGPQRIGVTVPEPVPAPQVGFTLQFESDEVLTRLVSRKDVGLYLIAADKSMRLSIDGPRMNFWPASLPGQYHEMDSSTVPLDVRRALLRSGTDTSVDAKWGVTLPPRTAKQLQQFLADASGGSLVIGSDGDLRLEP